MTTKVSFKEEISSFASKQNAAAKFNYLISTLWTEKTVELVLFRHQLLNSNASAILNLHKEARKFTEEEITIFDTLKIVNVLLELDLAPARIDLGKLALEVLNDKVEGDALKDYISKKLASLGDSNIEARDVVLYGFGRIGRLLARELIYKAGSGKQLNLRAIVTRDKIDESTLLKRASLLQSDSIHGDFNGSVEIDVENQALIINGITVYIISANAPEDIDYTKYGIKDALVLDNTGAFRDKEALSRHLKSKGAAKVLLTAPGKGIPNIVYGVNHEEYTAESHDIFSAASCTTNAIAPVLKVVEDELGIIKGHIETIHAYTNDQNLVDNMHKKYRRGRAAALNMVITETGAGKAVAKALPSLDGKLTSNAIRVPVPNGSLAILSLEVNEKVDVAKLNGILRKAALEGKLVEQIQYSLNTELVSSDIIGTSAPSIVDAPATIVSEDGKSVNLYVWYDNEYGYTHQVVRLARHIMEVRRATYY
ncbi:MAG TPA: glyceraldehyde-3-phosphate dehydrogenase [Chitinophagaceae bacterium]|nr:glyceraldehyde-3-phosphate dehydrogenase [Chitinophagaceae bacterium]